MSIDTMPTGARMNSLIHKKTSDQRKEMKRN